MSNGDKGRKQVGGLRIDTAFFDFVETEILPSIDTEPSHFWSGFEALIDELTPVNRELLDTRDVLQQKIDDWHRARPGDDYDHAEYVAFLKSIGYLQEIGEKFTIGTANVDAEIAGIAGPQLVVPVSNARFALNAANARWGSLYDALYGTDVISEDDGRERAGSYNPTRGCAVIRYAQSFLDKALPLDGTSHADISDYGLAGDEFVAAVDGKPVSLADPAAFRGHARDGDAVTYLFLHNGLHIEIQTDPHHPIGREAAAHVADVVLESAITTIQDCEDSVAAVDADDKVNVYRKWLGLMQGTLEATFSKGGETLTRRLNADREYTGVDGERIVLSGRSLMLVRNVGHLMTNGTILDRNGDEVFEGIMDAVITTACALANRHLEDCLPNSRHGSVYIVKPKMHGPDEAGFTDALFSRVEDLFGLERNTLKVGVMDEERRTTVNLMECIRAVKDRLVFINTGFLDRTGDEIHTSMQAGPMKPKEEIKQEPWITAYEDWNVDTGIRCGLPGRAQIGKGMWPKPDEMKQMMATKQAHPEAGANCAWVPSPTAATLHVMHYHYVDVAARQRELAARPLASLDDILTPPLCDPATLDAQTIQNELDNNAQGILGYVVRWIDQGVGCSKVPDINDVGLMEDRATLRISSQHMA
ncbi:MAG: malate synthase G, partial [Gammaproteobacteria bacterium]|nr:malate synthase G [Gammaproteobacteria bacterium]